MEKSEIENIIVDLTLKEKNALREAISPIYFSDSADYIRGLWNVVIALIGEDIENINLQEWLYALDPELYK
jgi:hypothetical protein